MSYWESMDNTKPWRSSVHYGLRAYLVGYFDSREAAQHDAEYAARMVTEDDIRYLEVYARNGERWKQLWYGRKARGVWYKTSGTQPQS